MKDQDKKPDNSDKQDNSDQPSQQAPTEQEIAEQKRQRIEMLKNTVATRPTKDFEDTKKDESQPPPPERTQENEEQTDISADSSSKQPARDSSSIDASKNDDESAISSKDKSKENPTIENQPKIVNPDDKDKNNKTKDSQTKDSKSGKSKTNTAYDSDYPETSTPNKTLWDNIKPNETAASGQDLPIADNARFQRQPKEEDNFQDYYTGDSGRAFVESDADLLDSQKTRASFAAIARYLSRYFRRLISLDEDKANEQQTIDQIKRNVVFRGTNLWILIFAILVASVGLNMNSPAVVIGAMLISPLMGPIMGVGLGVGINDLQLIKRSAKNLFLAALISIVTSAAYFYITPISDAQSELLSRTTPTIFDVIIAFFGGMAGIVAGSRSEKSNAIPGVAIATALMPPLCTAGYGIANGNLEYFTGALYLFFINSVFIAISTFIIVRYLKFPRKKFNDDKIEKRVKMYVIVIALVTLIPSVYFAYNLVSGSFFIKNASEFVAKELNFDNTFIINTNYYNEGDSTSITVTFYGNEVTPSDIAKAKKKMEEYDLPPDIGLNVRQSASDKGLTTDDVSRINSQIKEDLMRDLFTSNEAELEDREQTINQLKEELFKLKRPMVLSEELLNEIRVQYPNITRFSASKATLFNTPPKEGPDSTFIANDTVLIAYAKFKGRSLKRRDRQKLEEWLKVRTKDSTLILILD